MLVQNDFSMWFERMLSLNRMSASYKGFWLKGIFEELIKNDGYGVISFDAIIERMIANAWFPIVEYRLSFGVQDKLGNVVDYISDNYDIKKNSSKNQILDVLRNSEKAKMDKELIKMKKKFMELVPYRLLSPFFTEETKGIFSKNRTTINGVIELFSNKDLTCFYRINSKGAEITVNEDWIDYIMLNQALLLGWIQFKLATFIGRRNPNVPNVLMKLDLQKRESLVTATKYWEAYLHDKYAEDIYTKRLFEAENFEELGVLSIDHFIPWNFVMHNDLWNLVPTFKNVNSSKSDKLPKYEQYIDEFAIFHYESIGFMKETKRDKLLQSYYQIGFNSEIEELAKHSSEIGEEIFVGKMKEIVLPVWQIARNQGYEVWQWGG